MAFVEIYFHLSVEKVRMVFMLNEIKFLFSGNGDFTQNEKRIVGAICESLESQQGAHHFYLGSFAGGAMCGDDQSASLSPDFRCHNEILSSNFDNDMLFTMLVLCLFLVSYLC